MNPRCHIKAIRRINGWGWFCSIQCYKMYREKVENVARKLHSRQVSSNKVWDYVCAVAQNL